MSSVGSGVCYNVYNARLTAGAGVGQQWWSYNLIIVYHYCLTMSLYVFLLWVQHFWDLCYFSHCRADKASLNCGCPWGAESNPSDVFSLSAITLCAFRFLFFIFLRFPPPPFLLQTCRTVSSLCSPKLLLIRPWSQILIPAWVKTPFAIKIGWQLIFFGGLQKTIAVMELFFFFFFSPVCNLINSLE